MIPNSVFTMKVQILSPPIGDVPSLVLALAGIFAFVALVALLPAIFDRLRYQKKGENEKYN